MVLAHGVCYTAGNAGNSGSGVSPATLDMLSANTGVQRLDPRNAGSTNGAYDTSVVGVQVCPACVGTGKGNQTVFQLGPVGALAKGAAFPADAAITILPGFNQALAKTAASGPNPFGLWFADDHTLYVADEGDGVVADASTSQFAGLQKWIFDGNRWNLAYTLQNGLNLGRDYRVSGGLNSDGSIDPAGVGQTCNDRLASSDAAQASGESFTVMKTASYGQVLRGVALVAREASPSHPAPARE